MPMASFYADTVCTVARSIIHRSNAWFYILNLVLKRPLDGFMGIPILPKYCILRIFAKFPTIGDVRLERLVFLSRLVRVIAL